MPTFVHSTPAQLLPRLREAYRRTNNGQAAGRMAAQLLTYTNAELQAAFGISSGQVAALRGRMTSRQNAAATANSQRGE